MTMKKLLISGLNGEIYPQLTIADSFGAIASFVFSASSWASSLIFTWSCPDLWSQSSPSQEVSLPPSPHKVFQVYRKIAELNCTWIWGILHIHLCKFQLVVTWVLVTRLRTVYTHWEYLCQNLKSLLEHAKCTVFDRFYWNFQNTLSLQQ